MPKRNYKYEKRLKDLAKKKKKDEKKQRKLSRKQSTNENGDEVAVAEDNPETD